MLAEEASDLVARGEAHLSFDDEAHECGELKPRRSSAVTVHFCFQSDREISFFLAPPGTDRAATVNVYDKDPDRLVAEARLYVRALIAGRVEFLLRAGESTGRVELELEDGSRRRHFYNTLLSSRVGRGPDWEPFGADAFG